MFTFYSLYYYRLKLCFKAEYIIVELYVFLHGLTYIQVLITTTTVGSRYCIIFMISLCCPFNATPFLIWNTSSAELFTVITLLLFWKCHIQSVLWWTGSKWPTLLQSILLLCSGYTLYAFSIIWQRWWDVTHCNDYVRLS